MEFKDNEHILLYNSNKIEDRVAYGYLNSKTNFTVNEKDIYYSMLTEQQILEVKDQLNVPLEKLFVADKKSADDFDDDQ